MKFVPIEMEAHAGYRGAEYPCRFRFEGRTLEVTGILDRWYHGTTDPEWPEADYFKVKADDGEVYMLKYDWEEHAWYVVVKPGHSKQ